MKRYFTFKNIKIYGVFFLIGIFIFVFCLIKFNKRMNSVIPFRWIYKGQNKRLIGFVNEGDFITCYDGSGNHLMKVCDIDKKKWGISWNNYLKLSVPIQHYIIGEVKNLKKVNWV